MMEAELDHIKDCGHRLTTGGAERVLTCSDPPSGRSPGHSGKRGHDGGRRGRGETAYEAPARRRRGVLGPGQGW